MEDILNERAAKARRWFEVPVLVAALLVVPVIYIEEQVGSSAWQQVASSANWAIWTVFLVEYLVVVGLADRRWAYTKRAWLDVFIIVSSFPLMGSVLAASRLLRLVRLGRVLRILRLTRLAVVVARGGTAARAVFRRGALAHMLILTLLLALGAGGLYTLVEAPASLLDGLWWAFVTLTTVGYGDMVPVTLVGRAAGVVLMFMGIGFVALLTASVAAHFVEEEQDSELVSEMRRLHERLDELQQQLGQISGSGQP